MAGSGLTFCHVHCVAGEACALPHQTAFLGQQRWHFPADELVADWFLGVGVDFGSVAHLPRAARVAVVVAHGLLGRRELGLLGVKGVAVEVLLAADRAVAAHGVDFEDGVVRPVDVGVDPQTEEMLVVVCVDARVDLCAPRRGALVWVEGIGVQDTGQLDLELDLAALVQDPVDAVFVVGGGEDLRDEELACAGYCTGFVAEVGVLEQNACVFFVDADGVLNLLSRSGSVDKVGVHVVDLSLTVTAERQTVRHVSSTVFTQIKGMLALMRVFWVAVWDNHLGQRQTVEYWTDIALVVECDVAEYKSLAVVEADVDRPVLPCQYSTVDLERDAFWLCDFDRLNICPEATVGFDGLGVEVDWLGGIEHPAYGWNVNVNDLLSVCVEDWAEVEWVGVLAVVDMRSVVH